MQRKDTCILHIGSPKTGSSAIQESLALYDDGITHYARLSQVNQTANHAGALSLAVCSDSELEAAWSVSKGFCLAEATSRIGAVSKHLRQLTELPTADQCAQQITRAIRQSDSPRTIFSGEELFNSPVFAGDIIGLLEKHFREIKVVCYLRPLESFAASMLQERLKYHIADIFFEVGDKIKTEMFFHSGEGATGLNYKTSLEPWVKLIGKPNVSVGLFDRSSLKGGDVVNDFCHKVGLDTGDVRPLFVNQSLSAEAISILVSLATLGNKAPRNTNFSPNKLALTVLLSDFGSNRVVLGPVLRENLLQKYKSEIEWVKQEFQVSMPSDHPSADLIYNQSNDLIAYSNSIIDDFKAHIEEKWSVTALSNIKDSSDLAEGLMKLFLTNPRMRKPKLPKYFDPDRYLSLNRDVKHAGVNPGYHFQNLGYSEGRYY